MSKRGCETWVEFEMGNSPAAPELMDTAIVAEGAPPDPVPKSYRIPERPDDMCTPDDHELIAHLQQKKRSFEAAFLKPHWPHLRHLRRANGKMKKMLPNLRLGF